MVTVSSFLLSYIHHHRQRLIAGGEKLYPQTLVILFRGIRVYRQGKSGFSGVNPRLAPLVFNIGLYKGVTLKGK